MEWRNKVEQREHAFLFSQENQGPRRRVRLKKKYEEAAGDELFVAAHSSDVSVFVRDRSHGTEAKKTRVLDEASGQVLVEHDVGSVKIKLEGWTRPAAGYISSTTSAAFLLVNPFQWDFLLVESPWSTLLVLYIVAIQSRDATFREKKKKLSLDHA